MTTILEIKNKMVHFYGKNEVYINPILKFILAFVLFATINMNIGYMKSISTMPIALILALLCSVIPVAGMMGFSTLLILLDMYALSMEVCLVALLLFAVIYFLYFRFAPKDGIVALLTPVFFRINIPYVMPVATGLIRKPVSSLSVVCGTVVYYLLEGIAKNASVLASVSDNNGGVTSKFNVLIGQVLGNKEMYIVVDEVKIPIN